MSFSSTTPRFIFRSPHPRRLPSSSRTYATHPSHSHQTSFSSSSYPTPSAAPHPTSIPKSSFTTRSTRSFRNVTTSSRSSAPQTSHAGPSNGYSHTHPQGAPGAGTGKKQPSRHMVWYREIVPAMLPVIAIGTGVFFALQLTQTHLSHSRSLEQASLRISHLEEELAQLSARQKRQAASWSDGLGRVIRMVTSDSASVTNGNPATAVQKDNAVVQGVQGTTQNSQLPGQVFASATGVEGDPAQANGEKKKSTWWGLRSK